MMPSLTESQSSDTATSSSATASGSPSSSADVNPAEAVGELYNHLCQGETLERTFMAHHACGLCNVLLLCRASAGTLFGVFSDDVVG